MNSAKLTIGAATAALACGSLHAQEPINQPVADEYGVERKTGRALFPLPEIISVGGEGPSNISIAYQHIDGSSVTLAGAPSLSPTTMVTPPYNCTGTLQCEEYFYVTVNYGNISERFRRKKPYDTDPYVWEPEYDTGSTLYGGVFTDKHGLKITFGTEPRVEHPDGRVETFGWKTAYSNNFGYALKVQRTQSGDDPYFKYGNVAYQAVNLASDYCDLLSATHCSGVSKTRQGSMDIIKGSRMVPENQNPFEFREKFVFTDAAGGKTTIRNALIGAKLYRPTCYSYQTQSWNGSSTETHTITSCGNPPNGYREYPVGLTHPGQSTETHTISYGFTGTTHDDIRVTGVVKDGVSVEYWNSRYAPGEAYNSYGGVSWYDTTSRIDGVITSKSQSFKLGEFWGQSRRVMTFTENALGNRTAYSWDYADFEVTGATQPEGNRVDVEFDARRNIVKSTVTPKANSGDPILVTTFTYPTSCTGIPQPRCNKPTSMTDPKGNVTNYTYNDRGQVLTETAPAPASGAPRPKVTNTYTMRTAYIKASNGSPTPAGPPISLLTKSVTCRTQSSCAGTNDEVTTYYDYGPTTGLNNLNLRGVGIRALNSAGQMQTLWTCYQYNYFGEKIAETQPKAGLTSCS